MPPSRRRALRLGAVALAGSVAGCVSGALKAEESGGTTESADETTELADEPTTRPTGADRSLPEGSVEFPDGPTSPPERPADLTAESVRTYVQTYERRFVYNDLYRDDATEINAECGVDSVTRYGDGFRVVVWCSAYANYDRDATTLHVDYFTQYATYFVGPTGTVRREGRSKTRR